MYPRPRGGINQPDDPPDPDAAIVEQNMSRGYRVRLVSDDDTTIVRNPHGLNLIEGNTVILSPDHKVVVRKLH